MGVRKSENAVRTESGRKHGIYALLAVGYPADGAGSPTELHDVRKPVGEIVTYL